MCLFWPQMVLSPSHLHMVPTFYSWHSVSLFAVSLFGLAQLWKIGERSYWFLAFSQYEHLFVKFQPAQRFSTEMKINKQTIRQCCFHFVHSTSEARRANNKLAGISLFELTVEKILAAKDPPTSSSFPPPMLGCETERRPLFCSLSFSVHST